MKKRKAMESESREPKTKEEAIRVADIRADVESKISSDDKKRGYYWRIYSWQKGNRGHGAVQSNRGIIDAQSVPADSCIEDVVFDTFGAGEYNAEVYGQDKKKIFGMSTYVFAVGDLREAQSPIQPVSQLGFNRPRTGDKAITLNTQDKIEARSDVMDQKAKVEKLRLAIEEAKLTAEWDRITGVGKKDDNGNLDLRMQLMRAEIKEMIAALKPAGDSDTKKEIAELKEMIKDKESKAETNTLFQTIFKMMSENQRIASDTTNNILKQIVDQKSGKGMDYFEMIEKVMGIVETKRKWAEEDSVNIPSYIPPADAPWYEKLLLAFSGVVQKLSDNGTLDKFLAGMNNPPVQLTAGKPATPEELDAIAERMAKDAVEKYGKRLPPSDKTTVTPPTETQKPDTVIQTIPAGETLEEFNAKKEVINDVLNMLLKEMVLCPVNCLWIQEALRLSEDMLTSILNAKDIALEVFPVWEKYADANLFAEFKVKVTADMATIEKKKLNWLVAGFNTLKLEISETRKPEIETPAPNSGIATPPVQNN